MPNTIPDTLLCLIHFLVNWLMETRIACESEDLCSLIAVNLTNCLSQLTSIALIMFFYIRIWIKSSWVKILQIYTCLKKICPVYQGCIQGVKPSWSAIFPLVLTTYFEINNQAKRTLASTLQPTISPQLAKQICT